MGRQRPGAAACVSGLAHRCLHKELGRIRENGDTAYSRVVGFAIRKAHRLNEASSLSSSPDKHITRHVTEGNKTLMRNPLIVKKISWQDVIGSKENNISHQDHRLIESGDRFIC